MIRAVLDPGVLVAALISRTGAPAQLIRAWLEGRFDLVVSAKLLGELEGVLLRRKFRRYVSEEQARAFVALLARLAETAADPSRPPRTTPDPKDEDLVALARSARVHALVSGDAHLTGMTDAPTPVVTPRVFLGSLAARRG